MTSLDLRLRRVYRVPGTTREYQLVTKFHQFRTCFRSLSSRQMINGDSVIDKRGMFHDYYYAVKQKNGTYEYAFRMNLEEVLK